MRIRFSYPAAAVVVLVALFPISEAFADKIKNPTAVFSGLDKITGRTISFEVAINETVQFGSLQLTPRVCYSRPAYEKPQTTTFVEVDEITLKNEYKRIFTGWMFAASPGLNAIEHPVYDIWLTECKGGKDIIKTDPEVEERQSAPQAEAKKAPPVPNANQRPPNVAGRPVPGQQPTQRFFPTNEPPPPSTAPVRRPPAVVPQFDPTERFPNR